MNTLAKLPKPFFILAPMDDVTDTAFRQVIATCAKPDLFFTEFVNVDGLQSPGRSHLMPKLLHSNKEKPLIAQIWGKKPENFYKTAQELVSMGFAGVDINMGCPVKAVVKNGCCSALMNNRSLASEVIKATQEGCGGQLPVSVKTRLGFNEADMSWQAFLLDHKLDMLSVHGRTKNQLSNVPADWLSIGKIRELRDHLGLKTLIVGNGDVMNRAQGEALAAEYQLDGIMIGRGIFADPFVFAVSSPWQDFTKQQRLKLFAQHIKLFADTWQQSERRIATLNKFCKVYISGFKDAQELREQLIQAKDATGLLAILKMY